MSELAGPESVQPDAAATPPPVLDAGRRVAGSTITLVVSTLVVAAIGVVALHVLTHRLGKPSYGHLVAVLAFISATLLFTDLGINSYSGREIARRREDASLILGQNLGLRLMFSLLIIPVVIGLSQAYYPHSDTAILRGILIVSITIPFEAVRAVSLSYYVATIQNYKTAAINVVTQVVYVSGAVTSLYLGYGLTGCFVAYDVAIAATAVVAYLMVRRSARFVPVLAFRSWKPIIQQSLGIGAIQIVNLLYLQTNALLLSRMATANAVALYGVAFAIVRVMLQLPNAYMLSMTPVVVATPIDRLKTIVNDSCTYMAMAGVIAVVGTGCLADDVVRLLAPADFGGASVVLIILSLSVFFTCLTNVFTYSSFARDQHHRLLLISVVGLVSNVLLDLALIPEYHARGAAFATVIVEALILVGTYGVFRFKVGSHFDAWTRIGKIVVLGVGAYFGFRYALQQLPVTRLEGLAIGVIFIPALLLGAFTLTGCLPETVSLRSLTSSAIRTVRALRPSR